MATRNYSKSYQGSSFGFSKQKNRKRLIFKVLIALAFLGVALGSVYFFTLSRFFKINNISVSGNDYVVTAAIITGFNDMMGEEKYLLFKNDNINLLDIGIAEKKMMEAFPRIEEVKIIKKYPSSVKISIKEKEIAEILCQEKNNHIEKYIETSKCFFIDKNGIAFDEAAQTQGFLILKILDRRNIDINLNAKALSPEFVEFVGTIRKNFKNVLPGDNIKWFILDHPAQREATAIVDDWKIVFDTSGDPNRQLFVLKEILEKEVKDQKNLLEYIDLRVNGRAYYKLRHEMP